MASSMAKLFSQSLLISNCKYFLPSVRYASIRKKKRIGERGTIKHRNLIASCCESLAARGFLRSYKPYTPLSNVRELVLELCDKTVGPNFDEEAPLSRENKFALLNSCYEELNHSVPNSMLHKIKSIKDVLEFYETPVSTTVPFDELKNQELPPNLHVQYDYVRFHPDTDTKFNGISAFPYSSTIVTGLKYKGKYEGYKTESPFRDNFAFESKKS